MIAGFVDALGLARFALYIFDYGAPVGLRVALRYPERIAAIISQNGNAYVEGFSDAWGPWRAYWRDPSPENREACRDLLTLETIREWQYFNGADRSRVSPDGYTLDLAYLARPGADEIQLDLILDYRSNVARYPEFQAYFRAHQPPLLAAWGRNDAHFLPAGAEAYRRDLPEAEIHLLDAGHFALETHAAEIGALMRGFLQRQGSDRARPPHLMRAALAEAKSEPLRLVRIANAAARTGRGARACRRQRGQSARSKHARRSR